jgi:hypothetical protein
MIWRLLVSAVFAIALVAFGTFCSSSESTSIGSQSAAVERASRVDSRRAALRRAARFLWARQGADGGWHSETYAFFRSGQALTPFLLFYLLQVPEALSPRPEGGVERALEFLRARVNDDGVLGLADPDVSEYPHFATAFALRCFLLVGNDRDRELALRMRDYLISQQYRQESGFDETSAVFGGWGFGPTVSSGSPGHVDISYTRHILEALRDAPDVPEDVFKRARRFLDFLQRHPDDGRPQPPYDESSSIASRSGFDGGFYFSPNVSSANKGDVEPARDGVGSHYRSYATATCDGILALLAAGLPVGDARVEAAWLWLRAHPGWGYPGGVPHGEPNGYGDAIHFYHLAVRAEAYAALQEHPDLPPGWRDALIRILGRQERPDGSFVNTRNHLMKEDDPLLATGLAVVSLVRTIRQGEKPESFAKP